MKANNNYFNFDGGYFGYVPNMWFLPFDLGFEDRFKGNYGIKESANLIGFYFNYDSIKGNYYLNYRIHHHPNTQIFSRQIIYSNLFQFVDSVLDKKSWHPEIAIRVDFIKENGLDSTFTFKHSGCEFIGRFASDNKDILAIRKVDKEDFYINYTEYVFRIIPSHITNLI
ncbi:MAG: hypothetical protein J0L69_06615 [Bacteroidetes bacterium]|nr:hypothetical protein [Bacteroidota bacterium]